MTIETMGTGLDARLATITSLKQVFAPNELPDTINSLPCALILQQGTEYDQTAGGSWDTIFRVIILVIKNDTPSAMDKIIPYTEATGTDSVRAAINADRTLGGAASSCQVRNNSGMGMVTWGGHNYLGTEYEIIVYGD